MVFCWTIIENITGLFVVSPERLLSVLPYY